jgi:hypothetical protein
MMDAFQPKDERCISAGFRLAVPWVFAALLMAALSGCAGFRDVRTFALLSASAASHEAITRDYIGALDRRKQYQPEKFHGDLDALKVRRKAQQASLDVLQQTVADYMQGLGNLASGETRTLDRSLGDLSASLNKATLLDSNEKQAVGALSTLLARAATTVYRQHEMKQFIREGNPPIQEVIRATRKIMKNGIIADLQGESALIRRYYDNFMFAPDNPAEPVAMALAKEAEAEALGRVDGRIRSALSYDAVLDRIAAGHQYLYDNRNEIGSDALDRQLRPYIDALRAAYRDLLDVSR